MTELDLCRQTYNQKILDHITGIVNRHPYMRFNQIMYLINGTTDFYGEEPWDTYERVKKILQ